MLRFAYEESENEDCTDTGMFIAFIMYILKNITASKNWI